MSVNPKVIAVFLTGSVMAFFVIALYTFGYVVVGSFVELRDPRATLHIEKLELDGVSWDALEKFQQQCTQVVSLIESEVQRCEETEVTVHLLCKRWEWLPGPSFKTSPEPCRGDFLTVFALKALLHDHEFRENPHEGRLVQIIGRRSRYSHDFHLTALEPGTTAFQVFASPRGQGRHFYVDQTGVIRHEQSKEPDSSSPKLEQQR